MQFAGLVLAGKWNETDRQYLPCDYATFCIFPHQGQLLDLELVADRDQHDAPGFDLLYQRWWYVARGRGHHDGVERTLFGPTVITVANTRLNVVITELLQSLAS